MENNYAVCYNKKKRKRCSFMKKICCVNDMPGVGKIALSAMIPILSAKGVDVTCLPTALVSNTLDFGKFDILDTSDYMEKTVDIWNALGFKFDCIATGFMVNPRQIGIVEKLIGYQNREELLVVVDPIMGDEGKLYNGMDGSNVAILRELSGFADILIPNFTEATYLTDHFYSTESISREQAEELLSLCRGLGAKSVVITSAFVDGKHCVIGYDHRKDETFFPGLYLDRCPFSGYRRHFFGGAGCGCASGAGSLRKHAPCHADSQRHHYGQCRKGGKIFRCGH